MSSEASYGKSVKSEFMMEVNKKGVISFDLLIHISKKNILVSHHFVILYNHIRRCSKNIGSVLPLLMSF